MQFYKTKMSGITVLTIVPNAKMQGAQNMSVQTMMRP